LPLIVIDETVPHVGICPMSFHVAVPTIGLEYRKDVDGVGRGKRPVAFDNDQIIVIRVGGFETEVVRPGHHYRFFAERIEHNDFAMNVDYARPKELLFPIVELCLDIVGHEDIVAQPLRRLDTVLVKCDRVRSGDGRIERAVRLRSLGSA